MRRTLTYAALAVVSLQACKGSETLVKDSTTEVRYKIVATSEMSAVFGSQSGACFGAKDATFLARVKGTLNESDMNETSFEVIRDSNNKGIEQLFDIETPTTECRMDGNTSYVFSASEWSFSKVAANAVVPPKTETVAFGEPGMRQIAVQLKSDIGSTPIKSPDETQRCNLKNIKGQTILVSIDDSATDIAAQVRAALLPITLSDQVLRVVATDPNDSACASHRGRIYLPHFKCVKFGPGFSDAADINAKFVDGNRCVLAGQ